SVAGYLKVKPEILVVLDWIRIQRMNLAITVAPEVYDFFRELGLKETKLDPSVETVVQWMLFMVAKIMIHRPDGMEIASLSNETFRILYRFIVSGIGGVQDGKTGLPFPTWEIKNRSHV
ncbi:MAG: hypothetical protein LBJ24_03245, partial [Treponema sp.]|nr:hypothetical protein [Treponema sp.]